MLIEVYDAVREKALSEEHQEVLAEIEDAASDAEGHTQTD
jgi:hypothetical protein